MVLDDIPLIQIYAPAFEGRGIPYSKLQIFLLITISKGRKIADSVKFSSSLYKRPII